MRYADKVYNEQLSRIIINGSLHCQRYTYLLICSIINENFQWGKGFTYVAVGSLDAIKLLNNLVREIVSNFNTPVNRTANAIEANTQK